MMKIYTFIKFCSLTQLAHVYEHIFCRSLVSELKSLGLVEFLDFIIEANTYHDGFIYLTVSGRNEVADEIVRKVANATVVIDQQAIDLAIAQISAEKRVLLQVDADVILAKLSGLHVTPWQEIKDIKTFNAHISKEDNNVVSLSDMAPGLVQTSLMVSLPSTFITKHPELLPVAYVTSTIILFSAREVLSSNFGYYSSDVDVSTDESGFRAKNTFVINSDMPANLTEEKELVGDELKQLIGHRLFDRIERALSDPKYVNSHHWLDPEHIFGLTGILIGEKGWKQLATADTIKEVFEESEVTYGHADRDVVTIPLFA